MADATESIARVFPHSIEDGIHTLPVRQSQNPLDDILLLIQYDLIRAILARNRCLFRSASCADNLGPAVLAQLCKMQSQPAGDGVNEDAVVLADVVGFGDKSESGQALDEYRG